MGWVEKRFSDHLRLTREIPRLWDQVRDSIGQAVLEYNARTDGSRNHIDHTDCTARARLCARLHQTRDGSTIEVFLNEDDASLRTATRDGTENIVCHYRLMANAEGLEFFVNKDADTRAVSVVDACEMAIRAFIFNPFPLPFLNPARG
jgi:hypothetical protein